MPGLSKSYSMYWLAYRDAHRLRLSISRKAHHSSRTRAPLDLDHQFRPPAPDPPRTMSQSKLQLDNAAARALADLSSNIQARSQPSTPQNERRKTPKTNIQPEEHPPILDLLLSTRKPKSKLRQMAEKSARKYKRNSLVPSHDQSTDGLPLVEVSSHSYRIKKNPVN